jgi:hypothetical protein
MVANNYLSNQEVNHEDIYIYIYIYILFLGFNTNFIKIY